MQHCTLKIIGQIDAIDMYTIHFLKTVMSRNVIEIMVGIFFFPTAIKAVLTKGCVKLFWTYWFSLSSLIRGCCYLKIVLYIHLL